METEKYIKGLRGRKVIWKYQQKNSVGLTIMKSSWKSITKSINISKSKKKRDHVTFV